MVDLAITRRRLLQSGALVAVAPAFAGVALPSLVDAAQAQSATGDMVWRHGLSLFGDVKYPADFKRFDYVDPGAPKGGVARQIALGTFDNFNLVVAGVKGSIASGVGLIYEQLMTPSLDEVSYLL
jgi:microcin C transport system substrate-binding protein